MHFGGIKKIDRVWSVIMNFSYQGQFLLVTSSNEAYQGLLRAIRIPNPNEKFFELEFYWLCKQFNAPKLPWQQRRWIKHTPCIIDMNQYNTSNTWQIRYTHVYTQRPRLVDKPRKPKRLGRVKGYTIQGEPFWLLHRDDPSRIVEDDGNLVSQNEDHPVNDLICS